MTSLLLLTYAAPTLELAKGDILIDQGRKDGKLYVAVIGTVDEATLTGILDDLILEGGDS